MCFVCSRNLTQKPNNVGQIFRNTTTAWPKIDGLTEERIEKKKNWTENCWIGMVNIRKILVFNVCIIYARIRTAHALNLEKICTFWPYFDASPDGHKTISRFPLSLRPRKSMTTKWMRQHSILFFGSSTLSLNFCMQTLIYYFVWIN